MSREEEPRGAERSREEPRGAERSREEQRGAEIAHRVRLACEEVGQPHERLRKVG